MNEMKLIVLILLTAFATACNSQEKEPGIHILDDLSAPKIAPQIGEYVVSAFEDSKGHLWFGTLEKGVARYDGSQLRYFTTADGLPTNRVTRVIEDVHGVYWLGTGAGLSRFDGQQFTNFTIKEGDWSSNSVSQVFIDREGRFWIGTWGGVYTFDGKSFAPFPIPYPEVATPINEDTKNWITEIDEDPEGNLWFARDGYGACKYDGESFVHYLKKDGLHSNAVTEIEFEEDGTIWFGTRVAERDHPDPEKRTGKGGLQRSMNGELLSFPEIEGFNDGDVYAIYRDAAGPIWISTTRNGVYEYRDGEFKNYAVPASIMDMVRDRRGNLWLAGAGGLYRIDRAGEVFNVTLEGPWE